MRRKKNNNKEFYVITYIFVALFLCMIGYFSYYIQFKSIEEVNNSYNTRQENLAKRIIRGNITDRDGEILAGTKVEADGSETRVYPYGKTFAHVVGYSTKGRTGIELLENISLLTSNANIGERISKEMSMEKNMGDTIVSTLDKKLQFKADVALGDNRGAVIAMDPESGEILAMVSHPNFDPNDIVSDWEVLNTKTEEAPLLNRALSGLYPPGSTFKIVTLLEYLKENENPENYHFNCTGSFSIDGNTINCFHGIKHGEIGLEKSFAKSCNSSFANIGSTLRPAAFAKTADELLFNEELPIKLNYQKSQFSLNRNTDIADVLQLSIGQGDTLMSPIHLALITSAIANGGVLQKPMFVLRIENYEGVVFKENKPTSYRRLISEEEALQLTKYMSCVTDYGTAKAFADSKYNIAGKTGSAEYSGDKKKSHAWFTGFSEYEGKKLVVTVIAEGAGSGSEVAVPVAKEVFDKFYE